MRLIVLVGCLASALTVAGGVLWQSILTERPNVYTGALELYLESTAARAYTARLDVCQKAYAFGDAMIAEEYAMKWDKTLHNDFVKFTNDFGYGNIYRPPLFPAYKSRIEADTVLAGQQLLLTEEIYKTQKANIEIITWRELPFVRGERLVADNVGTLSIKSECDPIIDIYLRGLYLELDGSLGHSS